MNNSARTKKNKFCSFCKRTNHTRDECYHRKRRYKEKQTRFKNTNTEPHKTLNRGQFSEAHNVKTIKETPRDSNVIKIVKNSTLKDPMRSLSLIKLVKLKIQIQT